MNSVNLSFVSLSYVWVLLLNLVSNRDSAGRTNLLLIHINIKLLEGVDLKKKTQHSWITFWTGGHQFNKNNSSSHLNTFPETQRDKALWPFCDLWEEILRRDIDISVFKEEAGFMDRSTKCSQFKIRVC